MTMHARLVCESVWLDFPCSSASRCLIAMDKMRLRLSVISSFKSDILYKPTRSHVWLQELDCFLFIQGTVLDC
jgi:hypothetical protein